MVAATRPLACTVTLRSSNRHPPAIGIYKRSHTAAMYAYIAERALIRCTVTPSDFLEFDLINETSQPQLLWSQLSDFLGLPTGTIDTSTFPHEVRLRA